MFSQNGGYSLADIAAATGGSRNDSGWVMAAAGGLSFSSSSLFAAAGETDSAALAEVLAQVAL